MDLYKKEFIYGSYFNNLISYPYINWNMVDSFDKRYEENGKMREWWLYIPSINKRSEWLQTMTTGKIGIDKITWTLLQSTESIV